MRRLVATALALGLAADAGPARAAPPGRVVPAGTIERVAVITVELGGDAAPELKRAISRSLADGLAGAGLAVVSYDETQAALAQHPELVGCDTTACRDQLGTLLGVSHLVTAHVEASGADYAIRLELTSVRGDGPGRKVDDRCTVCTISDLGRRCASAAGALATATDPVAFDVAIESVPPGAAVLVDGVPAGQTPLTSHLAIGPHTLRAELGGHAVAERQVTVTGPGQRFELVLPARLEDRPDRPYRTWKWAVAGGAGAGVVAGVTLLAMHGRGTCDATGECLREYDTAAAGVVALVAGAGLGGAAYWMFRRDHRDAEAITVAMTPRGASVGFTF